VTDGGSRRGRLVLVSTPIGNLGDLPPRAVEELARAALICCEDTRRTGKLLQHAGISGVRMTVVNEHTEVARTAEVLELLAGGASIALVTDAGTPGISDPGERLARAVIEAGHEVTAVPGPAALVMALVISGFDTSRFVFEGFLPRAGAERGRRFDEIAGETRTAIIYEAPHRITRTVRDLRERLGGARRIALARELTKLHEEVWRGTLDDAADHVDATESRGEYVVVIEGARDETPSADDDQVRSALSDAYARGDDRKAAIATVAAALRVPKRRVYDIATSLPRPGRVDP
jgi:16S rRNA (cytidine1402-2'-O)-methyltransferase